MPGFTVPPTTSRRYLALGDSYTVGEGVAAAQTWPRCLAQCLRAHGIEMADPEVVAVTGWSTDELTDAIDTASLKPPYELVTLLIGVNNQYRGRDADNYREELAALLQRARALAACTNRCLLLVSIPDWGVTRFAAEQGRDTKIVAAAIDCFNAIARDEAARIGADFVDITAISRQCGADPAMLGEDGLHPSAVQYSLWLPPIAAAAVDCLRKRAPQH